MLDHCRLIWSLVIGLFRSRAALEGEILALRQQIIVLRRTGPRRLRFNALDRLILVGLYRLFPEVRSARGGQIDDEIELGRVSRSDL